MFRVKKRLAEGSIRDDVESLPMSLLSRAEIAQITQPSADMVRVIVVKPETPKSAAGEATVPDRVTLGFVEVFLQNLALKEDGR